MLATIDEYRAKTDSVFNEGEDLAVPVPATHFRDRIEALEVSNLPLQRTAAIFEMRCAQALAMGMEQVSSDGMVALLMGEPHTDLLTGDEKTRQTYDWTYDHHNGKESTPWTTLTYDWWRMERPGPWFLPPFSKLEKWRVRMGCLDYLKRTIPYGVLLRIEELKKTTLFNAFHVLAPIEAWERKTEKDPIVLASIWEITPGEGGKRKAGQVAHFFVAQW